jgi:hypothetical protein
VRHHDHDIDDHNHDQHHHVDDHNHLDHNYIDHDHDHDHHNHASADDHHTDVRARWRFLYWPRNAGRLLLRAYLFNSNRSRSL